MSAKVTTEEYDRYRPIDEQMDFHEKLRLLYVAATRARDHLVISVHRPDRVPPDEPSTWTHAELLWKAAQGAPHWVAFADDAHDALAPARPIAAVGALPDWNEWSARTRPRARGRLGVTRAIRHCDRTRGDRARAAVAAETAAADPGLAKEPRDLELPPWNKGRYGTAVGRAVHAVLQTVDLATGDGIVETAAAQAAAEGVLGLEDVIVELARSALATDVVRDAVANGYRREMYVAAPASTDRLRARTATPSDHRGVRRPGVPDTLSGAGGRRLQDRRVGDRGRPRRQGRALPPPGRVVRARARGGHGRAGRAVRVPVPRAVRCRARATSPTSTRAVDEVRALMREPSAVG